MTLVSFGRRFVLAAVGFVQGVALWALASDWPGDPAGQAWHKGVAAFVLVWGVAVQLCWTGRDALRVNVLAVALAAPLALVTHWVAVQIPGRDAGFHGDQTRELSWTLAFYAVLYVLMPFAQVAQETGRLRFPYPALFRHSWSNCFVLFVAWTFAAVFWAVIALWAQLFAMLGVHVFADVFFSRPFVVIVSATVVGAGVAIGRESEQVTGALRRITLAQFRTLMPILVVVALLFGATLPLTGLEPLWRTRHAAAILFWLVGLIILFVNAVVQDGEGPPPSAGLLRRGIETTLVATPLFAGLLLHALALRIGQHGLTPSRFQGMVLACLASLYALGYAAAVLFRRGRWLGLLQPVNVSMALVVAAVLLLMHSPVLDPLAWSARAQEARLLRGEVAPERFDFAFLRGGLGHRGQETLERLAALEEHPSAPDVRRLAALALSGASPEEGQRALNALGPADVVLVGTKSPPPELFQAIARYVAPWIPRCKPGRHCAIVAVDLVDNADLEYCLVGSRSDVACFDHHEGGWQALTMEMERGGLRIPDDLLAVLHEAGAESVPPPVRDLRIGTTVFRVRR